MSTPQGLVCVRRLKRQLRGPSTLCNGGVPEKEKRDPKEYVLVEVELTVIGYMQKCEAGVLLKYKPNEYRWQGGMKSLEFDENGNLLYKFSTDAYAVM